MNFCDSFFFQFFDKFFHVTVECFLGEHVLKGEGTALFDYAQSFSDHIPFILGGTDFVEDKVADSGIEGLIRIFQMGGISFVEGDPVGNTLRFRIGFTLLFGIVPLGTPVVHTDEFCLGESLGAADRQGSRTTSDVEQSAFAVPFQMIYEMLMDFCHHVAFAEGKQFMTDVHVNAIDQANRGKNAQDPCRNGKMQHRSGHIGGNAEYGSSDIAQRQHFFRYPVSVVHVFVHN